MDIKAIRKLPELQENQEWACEGGCDVIRPKHFENVFSESFAHNGSSIKRQSEFFWTCQNNHLLKVWCTDKGDYILLPEDFYQAEDAKVVESKSIHESIDLLDQDIESIKNSFLEESFLTNEEADTLEQLITKAMQLGEFYAIRDAKAQATPEGYVLVPVQEIKTWYLDESENIYREDPDWLCEIPIGEVVEVEHRVSFKLDQSPVFAAKTWDEDNQDVGYYETFATKDEAEKAAANCKAMKEAQEQSHEH